MRAVAACLCSLSITCSKEVLGLALLGQSGEEAGRLRELYSVFGSGVRCRSKAARSPMLLSEKFP